MRDGVREGKGGEVSGGWTGKDGEGRKGREGREER